MRRFFSICFVLLAAAQNYWWEFVRAIFYEEGWHMLSEHVGPFTVNGLAHYGLTAALLGVGLYLYWPWRPAFLRSGEPEFFLERDPHTGRYGIQTFPGVIYIQVSVRTKKALEKCRVWIGQVEFRENEAIPFSIENNERHQLRWARPNELELDIGPEHPPARITIAIYKPVRSNI